MGNKKKTEIRISSWNSEKLNWFWEDKVKRCS